MTRTYLSLVFIMACLVASSCRQKTMDNQAYQPRHLSECKRIISLAPSNTELIYSLAADDKLLAVTNQCNYPAQAILKEKIGTFTAINLERIAYLRPDLVLLVAGQEALAHTLKHNGIHVILLGNQSLESIAENLVLIGNLTGHENQAQRLANCYHKALTDLANILKNAKTHPRVFFCLSISPLITVGKQSFLNEIITAAGGINIAQNLPSPYPHYSSESLVLNKPELLFLPNEFARLPLNKDAPWKLLPAVRKGQVCHLPANQTDNLSRPTLRILNGIYWLSLKLHPELALDLQLWHRSLQLGMQNSINHQDKLKVKDILRDF